MCYIFPRGLFLQDLQPSACPGSLTAFCFLPDIREHEQLNDSSAGGEGAFDAVCEREGGGAVVTAAGRAGAAVITSAGAGQDRQGAGRPAGKTEGEGQSAL